MIPLKNNNNLYAFSIFLTIWAIILIYSGSINSGYHLTDNHELLRINKTLQNNSFFETLKIFIRSNIFDQGRFFPFIYIFRVTFVKVFGISFLSFSIIHFLFALFSSYFLFRFLIIQNFDFRLALVFPLLTLLGEQAAVWYRLGTGESLGMMIFSISLISMIKIFYSKNWLLYKFIFLISLIIISLVKESFIVVVPALVFWYLTIYMKKDKTTLLSVIKKDIFFLSSILLLLITEIFFILTTIGLNNGYAGIDSNIFSIRELFNISETLNFNGVINQIILNIINPEGFYSSYSIILVLSLIVTMLCYNNNLLKSIKSFYVEFKYIIWLSIFITIPQKIIYIKSGITERFYIPYVIGITIFIMSLLQSLLKKSNASLHFKLPFIIIILTLCANFLISYNSSKNFEAEGVITSNLFSAIEKSTTPNDTIIIVCHPMIDYENAYSLMQHLSIINNRQNLKIVLEENENRPVWSNDSIFLNRLSNGFKTKHKKLIISDTEELKDYKCIVIFPSSISYIEKRKIEFEKFNQLQIDKSTLFISK